MHACMSFRVGTITCTIIRSTAVFMQWNVTPLSVIEPINIITLCNKQSVFSTISYLDVFVAKLCSNVRTDNFNNFESLYKHSG